MERLTYRSAFGGYGCAKTFDGELADYEEKCAFRNALGKYEDMFQWHSVAEEGMPKEDGWYYFYEEIRNSKECSKCSRERFVYYDSDFYSPLDVIGWAGKFNVEPFEGNR